MFSRFLAVNLLFWLFAPSMAQALVGSPELALEKIKEYVGFAQKINALDLSNDPGGLTKKGAYCALSTVAVSIDDAIAIIFKRSFKSYSEAEQLTIKQALTNNYSDLFIKQLAPRLDFTFIWESAKVNYEKTRINDEKVDSYIVSVKTINPKDNRSVEITFNLVATNSQETSLQIYDMKLGPIQISSFYGSYLRDVNNGSKTITDVLEAWAADNQPCPANLEDYFKYFIEP